MHALLTVLLSLLLSTPPPTPDAPTSRECDRIALIGASVTWGAGNFVPIPLETHIHNEPVDLADVLGSTLTCDHEIVVSGGDLGFFRAPMGRGAEQAAAAEAAEPTLVLALDFLFWYGYGYRGADGTPHDGTASRLALLERGLKELDRFDCPVLVFDFPDMSPAADIILSRSQIPSPDARAALNARLAEWAGERDNVRILPLADTVEAIRADKGFTIDDLAWPAGSADRFILPDRLHPTTEGTIALTQMALRTLDADSERFGSEDYLRDPEAVRSRLEARMVREAREAGMAVKDGTGQPAPN